LSQVCSSGDFDAGNQLYILNATVVLGSIRPRQWLKLGYVRRYAPLGFGVKFEGQDSELAGQNQRAFPVIIQYVDDKPYVVRPKSQQMREPVLPLPAGTTYSYK
jgi:hypothetical protein